MFIFEDNKVYHMPAFFGGVEFDPDSESHIDDILSINFTLITEGNLLACYLPKGFELLRPEISIHCNQNRGVDFLNGGYYNLVQIDVPVRFNGQCDQLEGAFPLIIWENKTTPIIGGREESGQPKIYADIEDFHTINDTFFTALSYDGNTFLRLEMTHPEPVDKYLLEEIKTQTASQNIFGWRYIPKVGAPGADLSQPVLYPQGMKISSAYTGKGSIKWRPLSCKYPFDLYNKYESVKQLASLPIKAISPVLMVRGSSTLKPFAGRILK